MIQTLSDEELDFCESLYDPVCMSETLFSDFDNLARFDEKFGHVRNGQIPLLSFEYLIDERPELDEKENFELREGAGNVWCLGGRLFGKTMCVEKLDILIGYLLLDGDKEGFTSYDKGHIQGVLDEIIIAIENHSLLRTFKDRTLRNPYLIVAKHGWSLLGINMNVKGKDPGGHFYQKHFHKLFIEEASFETEKVHKARADSSSENGCVMRSAGMTNFTKYSPIGIIFNDLTRKPWVMNLPRYVNPKWDSIEKAKAIKKHHGEHTVSYKMFVGGEVMEEGISVFDMELIRPQYNEKKKIKHFEVTKESYANFEQNLIVDRPKNVSATFISIDVGETAPAEIIVLFQINEKYRYEYNITLHGLTDKEQLKILKYIVDTLTAEVIAVDCGDGLGRVIYRDLEDTYGKEHLVYYDGSKKIPVRLEKDENGRLKIKDGKPVYEEEFMRQWAVQRLKVLLYEERMLLPMDYKFDVQFNSVVSTQSLSRTIYDVAAEEDHLFDAFIVFAIAQWDKELSILKPTNTKKWCKTGV